jgi:preprotein translocase subunit SecY
LLFTNDFLSGIPLLGANGNIGYFASGQTSASGGLVWYLSAPSGVSSWLMPILDPVNYSNGHIPILHIAHVVIYFCVMVFGSVLFAKFWISTTGMGADSVAKQIQRSGMQMPGFRKDPRILERVLDKYIPTITILSGAIIGALASISDLIGTVGHASGTGVLLAVSIMVHFYEAMGREQMMEMNPIMRGFLGGE